MTKKSKQKFKSLQNEKSFWDEIKKYFSSILKGFQLSKIISDLRVRLSGISKIFFCFFSLKNNLTSWQSKQES